ncbi:MAG: hypothetical protein WA421_10325 [Nitrososphaeraceae archaeon]
MKRVVNAYTNARTTEILSGGMNMDFGKLALKTILSLRWPGLDEYLEKNQHMIEYIGDNNIKEEAKLEIPKDLITLFYNKQVIDVVKGNADGVNTSLVKRYQK